MWPWRVLIASIVSLMAGTDVSAIPYRSVINSNRHETTRTSDSSIDKPRISLDVYSCMLHLSSLIIFLQIFLICSCECDIKRCLKTFNFSPRDNNREVLCFTRVHYFLTIKTTTRAAARRLKHVVWS